MMPRRRIIPIFVPHLGCPRSCVFCNQRRISGCRAATPETVRSAVQAVSFLPYEQYELAFYGGSFTAIPVQEQEELLGAALPFFRSGRISSVRVSTRPDAIDPETLERLSGFGVKTVELGAQSMVNSVLEASNRGHGSGDTVRAAELVKASGMELGLQMMTGLPGSGDEPDIETARRIMELRPDFVRIYPTVVLRDTELCDMWESGKYAEHTVEDAVRVCSAIVPMFDSAGIPVIRLGLNPTDGLSGGDAVAGAYHPALGELVRSRIFLIKARVLLANAPVGGNVILGVNRSMVSIMSGQKRENMLALKNEFALSGLKVREAMVPRDEIVLLYVAKER